MANLKSIPFILILLLFPLVIITPIEFGRSQETNIEVESNLTELWRFTAEGGVREVALSEDGERLAVGGKGFVAYFQKDSNEPLWIFRKEDLVDALAMSPEGDYVAVGMEHAMLYLFKGEKDPYWPLRTKGPVLCVSLSETDTRLALGTFFGFLYSIDYESKSILWTYEFTQPSSVISLAIAAEGNIIAAGTSQNQISIFEVNDPEPLMSFWIEGFPHSLALSHDGRYLAVGSNSSSIYLFDLQEREEIWRYATNAPVRSVDITSKGEIIVAGSYDEYVYCIDKSSRLLWTAKTEGRVKRVHITSDGEFVFAGGTDKQLYAMQLRSGEILASYRAPAWITTVSSSSGGEMIAIGTGLKTILLEYTSLSPSTESSTSLNEDNKEVTDRTPISLTVIIVALVVLTVYFLWRRRGKTA